LFEIHRFFSLKIVIKLLFISSAHKIPGLCWRIMIHQCNKWGMVKEKDKLLVKTQHIFSFYWLRLYVLDWINPLIQNI
jgi:hypothetical protein